MMIHRENGKIKWWATTKYLVALLLPFWDGKDAPGRAYTKREMAILWPKKNPCKNAKDRNHIYID